VIDAFWQRPLDDLLASLRTGPQGLAEAEAATRRAAVGPNTLRPHRERAVILEFLSRFRNPLVLMLLVLFVLLVNAALHRPVFESFLFAVALAVGLTPELLPMIVSVTLSRGAIRLTRHRVIVKRLSAVQDLGAIDVLCTDKTGTLTEGKIRLQYHVDASGRESARVLERAYLNSFFETGIRSPLDDAILQHQHLDVSAWRKVDECRSTSSGAAYRCWSSATASGCSWSRALPRTYCVCAPTTRRMTVRRYPRSTPPRGRASRSATTSSAATGSGCSASPAATCRSTTITRGWRTRARWCSSASRPSSILRRRARRRR